MQNTESNYLIKLKIAIDKAKHSYADDLSKKVTDQSFLIGWNEAIADLSYASECGELASRQHLDSWLDPTVKPENNEDVGYLACLCFVHNEMNKGSSQ